VINLSIYRDKNFPGNECEVRPNMGEKRLEAVKVEKNQMQIGVCEVSFYAVKKKNELPLGQSTLVPASVADLDPSLL
jgi:hypothetical protein